MSEEIKIHTQDNEAIKDTQNLSIKTHKKILPKLIYYTIGFLLLLIVIIFIAGLFKHKNNPNTIPNYNIKIGSTTITPSEIREFSQQVNIYSRQLKINLGGTPVQVAENDLILHAALIDQAKKNKVIITQADLNSVIPSQESVAEYQENLKNSGVGYFTQILNDNKLYESKLENVLIKKKNLFIVGINYDAPYFNRSSDPAKLRSQASNILKSQFLPLFKQGDTQQQIGSHTRFNYTDGQNPPNDLQLYFNSMPTFAYDYNNCSSAQDCFNDAEGSSSSKIPGIVSTQSEVNKLTKVGQYTPVFTSRAGFIGILQLTGQTNGKYNSYAQLLSFYKKQYAPKLAFVKENSSFALSLRIHIFSSILNSFKSIVFEFLPIKAYADESSTCSGHDVTIYYNAYFYNTATGATTPASGAWLQESRELGSGVGATCPADNGAYYVDDSGLPGHRPNRMTTDSSGSATADDNCYDDDPYLLQRQPPMPSGFHDETFGTATVSSGSTKITVNSATDFGSNFGPAAENNNQAGMLQVWHNGIININHGMNVSITYDITPIKPNPHTITYTSTPSVLGLACSVLDFSAGNSTNASGTKTYQNYAEITLTGATLTGGKVFEQGGSTTKATDATGSDVNSSIYISTLTGTIVPTSQYVTVTITSDYYFNGTTPQYITPSPASATTPQCYEATCSIDNVVGDLPDGEVGAGGQATVTATIYNNSEDQVASDNIDNMLPIPSSLNPSGTADNLTLQTNLGNSNNVPGVASNSSTQFQFTIDIPANAGSTVALNGGASFINYFWLNPSTSPPGQGDDCQYTIPIYQPPPPPTLTVSCDGDLSGSATDANVPGYQVYVQLYADATPGNTGSTYIGQYETDSSGNFSVPTPSYLQDGVDHTIYAYALDPLDMENGGPTSAKFTGCESFTVTPGSQGANLQNCNITPPPSYYNCTDSTEDPNAFGGNTNGGVTSPDTSVTVTYGPNNKNWYGPDLSGSDQHVYDSFVGVPLTAKYYYTENGNPLTSGTLPPSNYIDYNYAAPLYNSVAVDTTSAGEVYCLYTSVSETSGFIQNDGTILSTIVGSSSSQPDCDTVTNRPFFKSINGSVSTTASFKTTSSSCTGGEIASWNNDTGTYPNSRNYGAGTSLVAIANQGISGFASNQSQAPNPNGLPYAMSLANSTSFIGSPDSYVPKLGGYYGKTTCLEAPTAPLNATSESSSTADVETLAQPGQNSYTYGSQSSPADVVLDGGNIPVGDNLSIFVYGNVYITGDHGVNGIVYDGTNAGWTIKQSGNNMTNNIPSFTLVATGNIYVDPNVTELDGIYSAQPDSSGNHGTIYDCGENNSGVFTPVQNNSGTDNLYEDCYKQLLVVGSFQANKVDLMRTYGSLRDEASVSSPASCSDYDPGYSPGPPVTNTCAAEVFELSPELYISNPSIEPPNHGALMYQADTGLPPIL